MTAPLLQIRGVTAYYGKIVALKGVDIDVQPGEIVTLIGANGAGKSTLMMTIFGDPRARDGEILYDGRDITRLPTHEIARLRIAQSPEGRRIFPRMTVLENLQMGAGLDGLQHFDQDLERVTVLFPRLKERLHQRGGTLSGGEQQMLAIARALMSRPRLLLLDEPSLGLAPLIVKQIFDVIRDINQTGRHDHLPGRAERLPCPQARAPRLCHGQRRDHHDRHGAGTAVEAGGARRLSGRRPSLMLDAIPREAGVFVALTVVLGGAAAHTTGRAIAETWKPYWQLVWYTLLLTAAVRFFHYALFEETLLSPMGYLASFAVLMAMAAIGHYQARARQMREQYGWRDTRGSGPLLPGRD